MTLPVLVGVETEYGVLIRGTAKSDPFLAADLLLAHCIAGRGGPAVNSADGFMLPNGGRFYIDHGHPEYCTPEVTTPRDLVAVDKAGEWYLEDARRAVSAADVLPAGQEIVLYKNNSDQQGTSYGCHENYLLRPDLYSALVGEAHTDAQAAWLAFLVTRPLIAGAGKVGAENRTLPAGYQLTQRADFFETRRGLQTTHHRPLLNTRDEAHAARDRFRRFHVIAGDANLAEYSTWLKIGSAMLVLAMIQDGKIGTELALADPLVAFHAVSRDRTFAAELPLKAGGVVTALDVQRFYLQRAKEYLAARETNPDFAAVVKVWGDVLDCLAKGEWQALAGRLDWAIKRRLLEHYLTSVSSDWDGVCRWSPVIERTVALGVAPGKIGDPPPTLPDADAKVMDSVREESLDWADYWRQREVYFGLRKLNLDYHDPRRGPAETDLGLFAFLEKHGAVERLVSDEEVGRRQSVAPHDTRAAIRGWVLKELGHCVRRADWSAVWLEGPDGRPVRFAFPDPASPVEATLDIGPRVAELIELIPEDLEDETEEER